MLTAIFGFILIILLVIAHELGHFYAARRSGVEVEEFGVGFPPKAKSLGRRNGTEYTLNWLPLGGFVRLKGEHDADKEPGTFGAASLAAKVQIMLAGVTVNFLIAVVMFTVISLIGMPQLVPNQFNVASDAKILRADVLTSLVVADSPAAQAGLAKNDIIRSIVPTNCVDTLCEDVNALQNITASDEIIDNTKKLAGQEVTLTYEHAGESKTTILKLLTQDQIDASKKAYEDCKHSGENIDNCPPQQSFFGVIPSDFVVKRATWSAPIVGFGVSMQFVRATLEGFASIFTELAQGNGKEATSEVSGMIGIWFIFSDTSFLGIVFLLMIVAAISLSLAVMNVLPIPALDGGRLFVTLLYRVLRRPLTQETEERIHGTGFALLMVAFAIIVVIDVQRFIL